ncbi:hypothetical protein R3P38DRAFT_1785861 [Favolaschia claudopus]|uniref:Uncharacterized protein n=1 Tax=Favolaschia claudopus TaxID=2862362 RepID=A0AAW0A801_9AGAR
MARAAGILHVFCSLHNSAVIAMDRMATMVGYQCSVECVSRILPAFTNASRWGTEMRQPVPDTSIAVMTFDDLESIERDLNLSLSYSSISNNSWPEQEKHDDKLNCPRLPVRRLS